MYGHSISPEDIHGTRKGENYLDILCLSAFVSSSLASSRTSYRFYEWMVAGHIKWAINDDGSVGMAP